MFCSYFNSGGGSCVRKKIQSQVERQGPKLNLVIKKWPFVLFSFLTLSQVVTGLWSDSLKSNQIGFCFIKKDKHFQVDRSGCHRTVVPVLVEKDTSWQDRIFDFCVNCVVSGEVPKPEVNQGKKILMLSHLELPPHVFPPLGDLKKKFQLT